jgi:hypothetical protein
MAKTPTDEQQRVIRLLDEATTDYRETEELLDAKRATLHDAIAAALRAEVGPSEVTRHSPYDRQHVSRIAREAGIPPKPRPGRTAAGEQPEDRRTP